MSSLSRRHFLRLGAGTVAALGAGCAADQRGASSPTTTTRAATPSSSTTTVASASTSRPAGARRRLVVVQLNGGNDALNTLVPIDGRYHDARPTLGLADESLTALSGVSTMGLHPSLAPLAPLWDKGALALLPGIGFSEPNRSHFVSMDRWWRADDLDAPGWLGRVIDDRPDLPPLGAVALGGGAPLLNGAIMQPTVVSSPSTFRLSGISLDSVAVMAGNPQPSDLDGIARLAYARAAAAVGEFNVVLDVANDAEEEPSREGDASISAGLRVAAQLLAADVDTDIVVVSAGGFDTHAGQTPQHAQLLADLASGLVSFMAATDAAGIADEVLLVTTSEFGRRVHENGSGGCDHGQAGVSLMLGGGVIPGIHGEYGLGSLADGDLRPSIDPRVMYTACLDWIGADADRVLGKRYDSTVLLRSSG